MKVNQWTLGLAATGVISLASAVQAEEAKNQVLTAVSGTTLSGYVSTSARWDLGSKAGATQYSYGDNKSDGFNLDKVSVTFAKNPGEGDWAAGYKAELGFGADQDTLGTGNGTGSIVKQAYVSLRAPIGNGLDLKLGVFDTIIGYESANAGDNPNYTRSYGYSVEPFQHTGLLASYRFSDSLSASVGVANTTDSDINARAAGVNNQTIKTYMASVTLTAPDSFGFLKGGTLTAGVVDGRPSVAGGAGSPVTPDTTWMYVGTTIPTGMAGLTFGASWDHVNRESGVTPVPAAERDVDAFAAYLSFKASDKLKLNGRVEYLDANGSLGFGGGTEVLTATLTADYALWENVISRLEYRLDHDTSGGKSFGFVTGVGNTRKNANLIALNVIYKF